MKEQKQSNSSEDMELENLLTEETKKLVGYIMPILEAEKISLTSNFYNHDKSNTKN